MLVIDRLRVDQGNFALQASIEVQSGSVTVVLGPSGGGKSTLLGAVAGFVPITAGNIAWAGQDITKFGPGDRPLAMLFQDHNLFPHLTVAQNVGLGLRPSLKLTKDETALVADVLRQVGLEDMGGRKPAALSGGQQSRVALARVLVMKRPLVLMDEPFSALGPGLRAEMLGLAVATLATEGRTLMMVTHDPADAKAVADQVVFVDGGVVSAPVETEAFFANPSDDLRTYLGA